MRCSKYDAKLEFGATHGEFTSLGIARSDHASRQREWLFACSCGELKWVAGPLVVRGRIISCGCYSRRASADRCRARSSRDGLSTSPLYRVWAGMMSRCYRPVNHSFADYGGRGIRVHERWHDFEMFRVDTCDHWFEGSNIDRINNAGDYGPDNFRLVTPKVNQRNRRNNAVLSIGDESKCIAAWAEEYGISARLLRQRMVRDGMNLEQALTYRKKK